MIRKYPPLAGTRSPQGKCAAARERGYYFVYRAGFLSRPRFSISGLIVGFCAFGDGPVLGHNSEITNRHQTHIKPTASPRQTHTMADSMCTPNPHQTQIEPRGHPDRKKEPRRETVTRPTLNPHQTHTKPRTNHDIKTESDNCNGSLRHTASR